MYIHTYTGDGIRMYTCTYVRVCVHTYIHAYIHTRLHIHSYIHTYIDVHAPTQHTKRQHTTHKQ